MYWLPHKREAARQALTLVWELESYLNPPDDMED
jgi:hypothetical protein